jgi:hypothetical protein
MPVTDPGPVGTCSAYAAHPAPTRFAAGSAIAVAVGDGAADDLIVSAAADVVDAVSDELSVEHETAPKIASALRPAAATALR